MTPRICTMVLLAPIVSACGAASSRVERSSAQQASDVSQPSASPSATPGEEKKARRALPGSTSFEDLVVAARRLDEEGRDDSNAACLLERRSSTGWVLRSSVHVASRPLPSPPDHLAERLREAEAGIRLLTRWGELVTSPRPPQRAVGREGSQSTGDLAAVTFTPVPQGATAYPAALLAAVAEGWMLRPPSGADRGPPAVRGPAPAPRAVAWLAELAQEAPLLLVVTAEADVGLDIVYDMLARLPRNLDHVVLATTLPPGTRLPQPEAVEEDASPRLCPGGLPALAADAEAGGMSSKHVLEALEALRPQARRCLAAARGPDAAGAKLRIAFRIGPSGAVTDACTHQQQHTAARLAACVLEAVRRLDMPEPQPPGFVDVELPLVVRPEQTRAPSPTCP